MFSMDVTLPVTVNEPVRYRCFLQFELSLLLYLPPTLSILTSCTFTQKWGRFHLKLLYTKMTASLMILTWYAVHNQLESIEGKVFPFYNFHNFFGGLFSRLELIISYKKLVVVLKPNSKVAKLCSHIFGTFWSIVSFFVQKSLLRS